VAIWGAYLIRSMLLWVLGMITFWTTRVSAIYDTYFTAELLLSGRLVPLALLPAWAAGLADLLPFKYTFGYPIEVLAGVVVDRGAVHRACVPGRLDRDRHGPGGGGVAGGRAAVRRGGDLVPRVRSPRTASRRPDDDRWRCRRGRCNPGIGRSSALPDAARITGNRPETSDAGH
ncbi:MAG TPA: hypothetical protein VNC85_06300, partial [Mycobacteriales bacterium]|nr:hypothetical protein [Mycobacteriales bacterium]